MKLRAAIIFFIVSACAVAQGAFAEAPPSRVGIALGGSVSNEAGEPLVGAVVSVFGKNLADGALIAVTDDTGNFHVDAVPPGMYRLRAYLSGFLPSAYAKVIVEAGVERVGAVMMSLAAVDSASDETDAATESARTLAELDWLVTHADRNVLKSDDWALPVVALAETEGVAARNAPSLAFSGEFGVRAAAYDEGLQEFPGGGAGLDARLAYARIHVPTDDDGQWLVSAQVLESALSSWAGRADYVSGDLGGHKLNAGVTYGNYLYGDLEDFRPPDAALAERPSGGERSTEWFGSVYGSDTFSLGSASVHAGVAYEYFGFLTQSGYASPRVEIAQPLGATGRTVLTGAVDYRVLAPGAEDTGLLSRVAYSDVYGGPAASPPTSLRAERTARFQVGLERQLSSRTRIGMRMFQESATDQLIKVYSKRAVDGAGQFTIGNKGDFTTRGVGLTVSRSFGAMEGSVGYTFGMGRALTHRVSGTPLPGDEDIHDVTTAVATSIDRTRTRLTAAYRFVSHPSFAESGDGFAPGTTRDSRFNIQVFQVLPFVGWNGTSWELMVAVRNLFYEDMENASVLDEVAVIEAPRRVLGGVTVRF